MERLLNFDQAEKRPNASAPAFSRLQLCVVEHVDEDVDEHVEHVEHLDENVDDPGNALADSKALTFGLLIGALASRGCLDEDAQPRR